MFLRLRLLNTCTVFQVITSDGAIVEVGADIFFRVKDPVLSVSSIQDLNHSLRIIAVASLQKHLSKLRLNHIESDKAVTSSLLHVSSFFFHKTKD